MFQYILLNLLKQKKEYLELKHSVSGTPLEGSIKNVISQIDKDINKILMLSKLLTI
ncbi:MAG: hypothetical protein ACFFD5_08540 [Candidatus Thorarchaeota archaeon]